MHVIVKTFIFSIFVILISCKTKQPDCDFKIDNSPVLRNKTLKKLLIEFKSDSFNITNNKNDIPSFIQQQLDCLTRNFSLSNPGKPYQATDLVFKKLPLRQLVFLAKNDSILVMTYLKGGLGTSRHVLLIKYIKEKITDLWFGNCLNGMNTKQGIIYFLERNGNIENARSVKKLISDL